MFWEDMTAIWSHARFWFQTSSEEKIIVIDNAEGRIFIAFNGYPQIQTGSYDLMKEYVDDCCMPTCSFIVLRELNEIVDFMYNGFGPLDEDAKNVIKKLVDLTGEIKEYTSDLDSYQLAVIKSVTKLVKPKIINAGVCSWSETGVEFVLAANERTISYTVYQLNQYASSRHSIIRFEEMWEPDLVGFRAMWDDKDMPTFAR